MLMAQFTPQSSREVQLYGTSGLRDVYGLEDEEWRELENIASDGLVVERRDGLSGDGEMEWIRVGIFKIEQLSTTRLNDLYNEEELEVGRFVWSRTLLFAVSEDYFNPLPFYLFPL